MSHYSYNAVELDIIRWAEARKIIPNSTSRAQAHKTVEEAGELLEAATALDMLRSMHVPQGHPLFQEWLQKYRDAVGDVLVTLINGAALEDVKVVECAYEAYEEIKDRKGTLMPDGTFVKDTK